jgi:hypothetical protein
VDVGDGHKKLRNARMAVYWDTTMHGVLGLAAKGPSSRCRISPRVAEISLTGVSMVVKCDASAVARWEDEPWG